MKNNNKFLDTLDNIEIDMPELSEDRVAKLLNLELKKAGIKSNTKIEQNNRYRVKFISGLLAACLMFTIGLSIIKGYMPSVIVNPPLNISGNNISGNLLTGNKQIELVKKDLSSLSYKISIPKVIVNNYEASTANVRNSYLSIKITLENNTICFTTIPSNQVIGTASVAEVYKKVEINNTIVKAYGTSGVTKAQWNNKETNYQLTFQKPIKEEILKKILKDQIIIK